MPTDYPYAQIIRRARKGREAIYPYKGDESRFSVFGANVSDKVRKFYTLEDLMITAPQFTPHRLEKSFDLISREPFFRDVDTSVKIGGFNTKLPIVQASMGSPEDWNIVADLSAKACAQLGLIYGIGENVAATWGYDERVNKKQPCLMDRILEYFENRVDGYGGILIQQNEEDAQNELWNKIYSDIRLKDYFDEGLIAFEIKGGQGAKSGIGGEKIVDRETALRLQDNGYIIHPDPSDENIDVKLYERHSSPDIFTEEILKNRILKLRNDYPRAKIWLKTGPYRDLTKVIRVATDAGIDAITIDGKEGGTGMSPTVALQNLGLPTLACLRSVKKIREEGIETAIILSGRFFDGAQVVKALALGVNAVAMGRPFLIAANAYPFSDIFLMFNLYKFGWMKKIGRIVFPPSQRNINYITNFVETIKLEMQLLISSLGKYSLDLLGSEDLMALKKDLADSFELKFIFDDNEASLTNESIKIST